MGSNLFHQMCQIIYKIFYDKFDFSNLDHFPSPELGKIKEHGDFLFPQKRFLLP